MYNSHKGKPFVAIILHTDSINGRENYNPYNYER